MSSRLLLTAFRSSIFAPQLASDIRKKSTRTCRRCHLLDLANSQAPSFTRCHSELHFFVVATVTVFAAAACTVALFQQALQPCLFK
jgi:hypothetical protein